MLIKRVNKNTIDVFFNNGWNNWARLQMQKNHYHQVAGALVPPAIMHSLNKRNKG